MSPCVYCLLKCIHVGLFHARGQHLSLRCGCSPGFQSCSPWILTGTRMTLKSTSLIPLASTTSRVVSSPLALQLLLWGSPGRFQAQRLCTCCSFCLECSSPQYPYGSLISSRFSQGHLLRPCLFTPFQVAAPFPITADVPLPPTPCLSSSY